MFTVVSLYCFPESNYQEEVMSHRQSGEENHGKDNPGFTTDGHESKAVRHTHKYTHPFTQRNIGYLSILFKYTFLLTGYLSNSEAANSSQVSHYICEPHMVKQVSYQRDQAFLVQITGHLFPVLLSFGSHDQLDR